MDPVVRYPNRLGLRGWAVGGRWRQERWLFTLHRLTGLGLLGYFLLHVLVTATRAELFGGQARWDALMGFFRETTLLGLPVFRLGELAVFLAFAFHAFNGLRLTLLELGWGVGPAEEPVFPYRSSLDVQAPLTFCLMLLAAVLATAGIWNFFWA